MNLNAEQTSYHTQPPNGSTLLEFETNLSLFVHISVTVSLN